MANDPTIEQPKPEPRDPTTQAPSPRLSPPQNPHQSLKEISIEWINKHSQESGFYPLGKGMDALGARLRLTEQAQTNIDIQSFLMKNDSAGAIMMNALLNAADRGVKVRFLLDDFFNFPSDRHLWLIERHPNIEVRIFNPISRRGLIVINFLRDFKRANRRMHSKSFSVDRAISILGGRNIADEYFQLNDETLFVDFEVLALGPIVTDISNSFDDYWNHSHSIPFSRVSQISNSINLNIVRKSVAERLERIHTAWFQNALANQFFQDLIINRKSLYVAKARLLYDDPNKLLREFNIENMRVASEIRNVLLRARKELVMITPYFIPGEAGLALLRTLASRAVRVVIVTNSLASNNHVSAHAAYARYRRRILATGAELYETRVNASLHPHLHRRPKNVTLHSKAFLIDGTELLVGSMNLDPRSLMINAELGVLLENKALTQQLVSNALARLKSSAYKVIDNNGKLEWHCQVGNEKVIEKREPSSTVGRRFRAWLLRIIPENQL